MSDPTENVAEPADPSTSGDVAPAEPQLNQPDIELALAKANALAQENYDLYLRAKAEMENIRRRSAEDVLKANKFGAEKMAEALLAIKDSIDAALLVESPSVEAFKTGIELTGRQLSQLFERFSIVEVNPAGAKFDPTRHQAISAIDSDQVPNTVINVMQKGYLLHDRVLRPALVAVAKEKPAEISGNS